MKTKTENCKDCGKLMCSDCGECIEGVEDHQCVCMDCEINDGCDALLGWLETQQLHSVIAIPVLVKTILAIIHADFEDDPKKIKKGQNVVAKMLREGLVPN